MTFHAVVEGSQKPQRAGHHMSGSGPLCNILPAQYVSTANHSKQQGRNLFCTLVLDALPNPKGHTNVMVIRFVIIQNQFLVIYWGLGNI